MKTNWFGILILVVLSFVLAGCPPAETAKTPAEKAAAAAAAPVGELDTSKVPPPRQPLDATPDLQDARLRITDRGLELMIEDGVPEEVINKLKGLKGTNYSNASEFLDAVGAAIGAEALATHQLSILRNSLAVNLGVEPAFPGAQLRLAARQPGMAPSPFGIVYFDFDRSEIKPEFIATIQKNARLLRENPDMKVVIEGHCDERGTTEYNLALGERRATAVQKALIANGVSPEQLQTVSFGEERPVDMGHNEEAWAKNRRGVPVPAQ
jgi:peptidoglycan-associated lipoprotein